MIKRIKPRYVYVLTFFNDHGNGKDVLITASYKRSQKEALKRDLSKFSYSSTHCEETWVYVNGDGVAQRACVITKERLL